MNTGDKRSGASLAATAMHDLTAAKDRLTHDAKDIADGVKDEVLRQTEGVRDEVRHRAEEGQSLAAESLGTFAEAIRKANDQLKDKNPSPITNVIGEAAHGLEGLSRALGQRSLDDLIESVRSFGRSNPGAFIAGSVLAGLALGRFAKSSAHHAPKTQPMYGGANEPVFDESFDGADDLLSQLSSDYATTDIDEAGALRETEMSGTNRARKADRAWGDRND